MAMDPGAAADPGVLVIPRAYCCPGAPAQGRCQSMDGDCALTAEYFPQISSDHFPCAGVTIFLGELLCGPG